MRSGGCAVQQTLAAEAAGVVRQAVALARRRGHAQVTPLHVASAMLSAAGLLRAACLRSHSHPLQCKALELCFNVALNRLPAAAAAMFHGHGGYGGGGHHHAPVLSNALVAAFKRAQAHQRRGTVEGGQPAAQPPPVLAAKAELEQLIISILDDPSVSRVMREAGFSSSQVRASVEKSVSSPEHHPNTATSHAHETTSSPRPGQDARRSSAKQADDDAMRVLDCMAAGGSKRCVVVVGESAAAAEGVVKAVMDRVSKGELQLRQERLKNVQFVPLSAASFQRMVREEVEARAGDLRALVRQVCAAGKGVVLVLYDLAYAADAWNAASERTRLRGSGGGGRDEHGYCPVQHAIMEVSSLVFSATGGRGLDRFWLLGFGNNQAYMKSRAGQPSLASVWELHPVVVPGGSLALGLSCASEAQASQERSGNGWPFINGVAAGESELTCHAEAVAAPPSLPPWLLRYQVPDQTIRGSCKTSLQLQDRNISCNNLSPAHHTSELTLSFSSTANTSPAASSISGFAHSYNAELMMSSKPWQLQTIQPWPNQRHDDPIAKSYDHHPLHRANASPESYSVSNSSYGGMAERPKFMELSAENLKILCTMLENRVPRHKDVVADIASTVLQCRSGMARRMRSRKDKTNAATWLLFQGKDSDGKKALAQELSRVVFGSYTEFTSIAVSEFTSTHSESRSGELILKRQRSPDNGHGYVQRLYEAILENPHRVIMIDSIEQLDYESEINIMNVIRDGRIKGCNSEYTSLEDAIIVLSCEALDSRSNASSPRLKQRVIDNEGKEGDGWHVENGLESSCFTLDLNACAKDEEGDHEECVLDNVGILNVVDGVFCFRLTDDL